MNDHDLVRLCLEVCAARKGEESAPVLCRLREREMELELRERELHEERRALELSRDLFELAPVGLLTLTSDGVVRAVNRAAAQLLGGEPAQLLNRGVAAFLPLEDAAAILDHLREVFAAAGRVAAQVPVRASDGVLRQLYLISVAQRAAADSTSLALTACEELNVEAARGEDLQLHSAMLANLGEGVMLVRKRDGVIVETNPAQERMFGYAPGEMLGRPVSELNAGDGEERVAVAGDIIRVLNETGAWKGEIHNRRKDGTAFWSAAAASTFEHRVHGTVWLSVHRDITAQKVAEARLSESESFARSVLNALSAHIAVLDGDGRIVSVNDAWREFAGENGGSPILAEGVGINYLSVCGTAEGLDSEYAEQAAEGIRGVLDGSSTAFALEYPCHSPAVKRWFLLSATPLEAGVPGAVVAHTDVTERKRLEEDRLRRGEALARASRLNSVAILASSLVHELTQPLTAASLYSEAATSLVTRGNAGDTDLAEAVGAIHAQIKRASEIVHRLRNFIRGRTTRVASMPLRHLVVQAIKMVEPMAIDKKVELILDPIERELDVEVDGGQIEQVLVNLLCNAVESVESAGGALREVCVSVRPEPEQVQVSVEDTGVGLAPGAAERLFDVFETSKESGMGMGLAICRDIIEGHRGRLWADSAISGGAVFRFTLPRSTGQSGGES